MASSSSRSMGKKSSRLSLRGMQVGRPLVRPSGNRPKRRYFLIVCEGEATEPNYFHAIANQLPKDMVKRITVMGTGRNTKELVDIAKKEVENRFKSGAPSFYHVWLVFDKDEFPNDRFNGTIQEVEALNKTASPQDMRPYWHCAWSNEAFELWYVLHFQEQTGGAVSRMQYQRMLETAIRDDTAEKDFHYMKNDPRMFARLKDRTHSAVERAERALSRQLQAHGTDWAAMNPATRVHELVKSLLAYLGSPSH